MKKLLFRNAFIASSTDVVKGDLLVEGEKIAAVGEKLNAADAKVIEAEGNYLLPGGVDPHTHFDLDVGFTRASDDFYTGTVAAAYGGTTTIVDHIAFGPEGCRLTHQPQVYRKLAEPAVIDYGLHGNIQHVNASVLEDMALLRDEGFVSFKMYMTYQYKLNDDDMLRVLKRAKELDILICTHCENDAIVNSLRAQFSNSGKTQPRYHALSRPAETEAEAVFRFLTLAKAAGEAKVYIVHLSSGAGLDALRLLRKNQKNIWVETCPQYLFLDDSQYEDDLEGLKAVMSPPLRKQKDIDALWDAVEGHDIDVIGTDHCPFNFETQKKRGVSDFTLCPNGAPGVELRFPLMFSEGFMKKRLSLPHLVQICCKNPADIFGLGHLKGDIRIGADADLVLFDPNIKWTATKEALHERVDYTPYEGIPILGKPVITVSRGEVIVENDNFVGQKGRGRYIIRK